MTMVNNNPNLTERNVYFTMEGLTEAQIENIKEILDENHIEYKEFGNALDVFCWEEAYTQLMMAYDNRVSEKSVLEFISENREELYENLRNDDYITDYNAITDITNKFLEVLDDEELEQEEIY